MNAKRDFYDYARYLLSQLASPAPTDAIMSTVDRTRLERMCGHMQEALERMAQEDRTKALEWFRRELDARVAVDRAPEWLIDQMAGRRTA